MVLDGSDWASALYWSVMKGARDVMGRARATGTRSYLSRPLLHNATNEGAEVISPKADNDVVKYHAQKHAADQALLASSRRSSCIVLHILARLL